MMITDLEKETFSSNQWSLECSKENAETTN